MERGQVKVGVRSRDDPAPPKIKFKGFPQILSVGEGSHPTQPKWGNGIGVQTRFLRGRSRATDDEARQTLSPSPRGRSGQMDGFFQTDRGARGKRCRVVAEEDVCGGGGWCWGQGVDEDAEGAALAQPRQ